MPCKPHSQPVHINLNKGPAILFFVRGCHIKKYLSREVLFVLCPYLGWSFVGSSIEHGSLWLSTENAMYVYSVLASQIAEIWGGFRADCVLDFL